MAATKREKRVYTSPGISRSRFPLFFPFNLAGLIGCGPKRTGEKSCTAMGSRHQKKPAYDSGLQGYNFFIADVKLPVPLWTFEGIFPCPLRRNIPQRHSIYAKQVQKRLLSAIEEECTKRIPLFLLFAASFNPHFVPFRIPFT